jgi:hypothetical protein
MNADKFLFSIGVYRRSSAAGSFSVFLRILLATKERLIAYLIHNSIPQQNEKLCIQPTASGCYHTLRNTVV